MLGSIPAITTVIYRHTGYIPVIIPNIKVTDRPIQVAKTTEIPENYTADFMERMDGRTRFAQVVQTRFRELTTDMGGLDNLSYQRRSLAKRIVHLECLIEQQEAALARGEDVDPGKVSNTTNTLIGLLKTVGLDKAARDVPSLSEYLSKREGAKE